jgi:hypothetical protein
MDDFEHSMSDLFAQLGLANSAREIDRFIHTNRPIPENVLLPDAECWTQSQADFLREAIADDSDWAELVDQLNSRLRQ